MRKVLARYAALGVLIGAFVAMPGTAAFAQDASDHCPDGGTKFDSSSGSQTIDGVTISWSGTTVTISGGSATICVKGGTSGNSGIVTLAAGTYSTAFLGLLGPQDQAQDISYLVVYDTGGNGYPPRDNVNGIDSRAALSTDGRGVRPDWGAIALAVLLIGVPSFLLSRRIRRAAPAKSE